MNTNPPARRRWLLLAGATAGAAGLGAAWWSRQRTGVLSEPAPADFWTLRLPQPGGGELAFATLRGRPLLVNFWATWCAPCIREMPALDRFASQFRDKGWQVVGIAVDQDKPVRDFLSQNRVSYSIALAGFDGITLSRQLGNEGGVLPFTVAFDAAGNVARRHLGETRFEMLADWGRALAKA
ncbi:MAG: TlpA family protein disulfide reductase [Rubrivivax sp.]|nr:TlpA family protein disulfide reductase [Rubrivivax sp.]